MPERRDRDIKNIKSRLNRISPEKQTAIKMAVCPTHEGFLILRFKQNPVLA
jgi:hypothetical protein